MNQNTKAPELRSEAKSANEKVNVAELDCITDEENEALSLEIKRAEREYGRVLDEYLVPYAQRCTETGQRFSVSERLNFYSWTGRGSINHNLHPILSRLLIERLPQAKDLVELRRSKWDLVFSRRPKYVAAQETAS